MNHEIVLLYRKIVPSPFMYMHAYSSEKVQAVCNPDMFFNERLRELFAETQAQNAHVFNPPGKKTLSGGDLQGV
jgi:hypothetical protein